MTLRRAVRLAQATTHSRIAGGTISQSHLHEYPPAVSRRIRQTCCQGQFESRRHRRLLHRVRRRSDAESADPRCQGSLFPRSRESGNLGVEVNEDHHAWTVEASQESFIRRRDDPDTPQSLMHGVLSGQRASLSRIGRTTSLTITRVGAWQASPLHTACRSTRASTTRVLTRQKQYRSLISSLASDAECSKVIGASCQPARRLRPYDRFPLPAPQSPIEAAATPIRLSCSEWNPVVVSRGTNDYGD